MKLCQTAVLTLAAFLMLISGRSELPVRADGFGGRLDAPPPPLGGTPPVIVPTDVTNPAMTGMRDPGFRGDQGPHGGTSTLRVLPPISGIRQLPAEKFVELAPHSSADGIYVHPAKGARLSRPNPYEVDLKTGQILVSVNHPSKTAIVSTDLGEISIQSEGDVLISFDGLVLRVMNMVGQGNRVQLKLDKGPFAESGNRVVAIDSGYELVAGMRRLNIADLHPADAIGRRAIYLLSKGYLAVGQYSLLTVLRYSDLISDMEQPASGPQERRILANLSKMAAVQSYIKGAYGYVTQAKAP